MAADLSSTLPTTITLGSVSVRLRAAFAVEHRPDGWPRIAGDVSVIGVGLAEAPPSLTVPQLQVYERASGRKVADVDWPATVEERQSGRLRKQRFSLLLAPARDDRRERYFVAARVGINGSHSSWVASKVVAVEGTRAMKLQVCEPLDALVAVTGGTIQGDILELDVLHDSSSYRLTWSGALEDRILLQLTRSGDPPGELVLRKLKFDLSPLMEAYRRATGRLDGNLRVSVEGCPTRFRYRF